MAKKANNQAKIPESIPEPVPEKVKDGQWNNRIVGHADVDPASLIPNPKNFRIHGDLQSQYLGSAINSVGFIRSVTVNKRTGMIIDGHLRVVKAISSKQKLISVEYVDLSPEEESLALATVDPLAGLAENDNQKLDELLKGIGSTGSGLDDMLRSLESDLARAFEPSVEPEVSTSEVTSENVAKTKEELEGKFEQPQELVKVMCPHCAHEFMVAKG